SRDGRVGSALAGREGRQLEEESLPKFLQLQRWFAAKDRRIRSAKLRLLSELTDGQGGLAVCDVGFDDETQSYFLPLSARWGEENIVFGSPTLSYTIARLRRGPRVGGLIDGV